MLFINSYYKFLSRISLHIHSLGDDERYINSKRFNDIMSLIYGGKSKKFFYNLNCNDNHYSEFRQLFKRNRALALYSNVFNVCIYGCSKFIDKLKTNEYKKHLIKSHPHYNTYIIKCKNCSMNNNCIVYANIPKK